MNKLNLLDSLINTFDREFVPEPVPELVRQKAVFDEPKVDQIVIDDDEKEVLKPARYAESAIIETAKSLVNEVVAAAATDLQIERMITRETQKAVTELVGEVSESTKLSKEEIIEIALRKSRTKSNKRRQRKRRQKARKKAMKAVNKKKGNGNKRRRNRRK